MILIGKSNKLVYFFMKKVIFFVKITCYFLFNIIKIRYTPYDNLLYIVILSTCNIIHYVVLISKCNIVLFEQNDNLIKYNTWVNNSNSI